jgi:hypothetical protein
MNYHRFRRWPQAEPHYVNRHQDTVQHCHNCGTEFRDNFCPRCGQRAEVGRVGWNSIRENIALLWGLDSRSLTYTLVQLLGRPGYLVRDYISGHRQVSFPPVKMLVIVCLFVVIFESVFHLENDVLGIKFNVQEVDDVVAWINAQKSWATLLVQSILILPTWLVFRFAPGYPHHTLPEGFFIQAFMSTIMLLLAALVVVTKELWLLAITPFIYIIAYNQLFGYRWWPTIWRVLLSFFCFIIAFGSIDLGLKVFVYDNKAEMVNFIASIIMLVIFTLIGFLIGKRTGKKRAKRENVDESVTSVTA